MKGRYYVKLKRTNLVLLFKMLSVGYNSRLLVFFFIENYLSVCTFLLLQVL